MRLINLHEENNDDLEIVKLLSTTDDLLEPLQPEPQPGLHDTDTWADSDHYSIDSSVIFRLNNGYNVYVHEPVSGPMRIILVDPAGHIRQFNNYMALERFTGLDRYSFSNLYVEQEEFTPEDIEEFRRVMLSQ